MPQFDCPACGTTFRSFTILVNHMDSEHPNDYATHGDAVLEHVAVQQAQKQARRAEQTARTERVFELPQHPPLPRPYLSDLDPAAKFGNIRTFNAYRRMEKAHCSQADGQRAGSASGTEGKVGKCDLSQMYPAGSHLR